jgi:hypothetical protein
VNVFNAPLPVMGGGQWLIGCALADHKYCTAYARHGRQRSDLASSATGVAG